MRISDWSSDVCSSDLHNVFVLYIQTRGSKSQKHYAEKFSALGEDILQILISDRDAVVRGVTKEDAFALIDEFSKRYDAESNLSFSAIFLSLDDSKAFGWYGGRNGEKIQNWTMRTDRKSKGKNYIH